MVTDFSAKRTKHITTLTRVARSLCLGGLASNLHETFANQPARSSIGKCRQNIVNRSDSPSVWSFAASATRNLALTSASDASKRAGEFDCGVRKIYACGVPALAYKPDDVSAYAANQYPATLRA